MQQAGIGGRNVELHGAGHNELEVFSFRKDFFLSKDSALFKRWMMLWRKTGKESDSRIRDWC